MRKNTLIKLLTVLAMCFLICAAFASCEEVVVESVEEAKVIVGVAFDAEGNLVISYNDNTTQKVALPEAESCEHNRIADHTLIEHTATANGKYLEVCDDCGYAWIKFEQRHDWIHNAEVVAPTCTAQGYTIAYYCNCGAEAEKTEFTDPIPHSWDNGTYVSLGNDCEDGYEIVYKCVYKCGATTKDVIDPKPNTGIDGRHNVTKWNVPTAEYTTDVIVVSGNCDDCGKLVTYTLNGLKKENGKYNDTDYNVVVTNRTNCREAVVATFTLKANNSIKFVDVVLEAAGVAHKLTSSVTGEKEFVYQANVECLEHNTTHSYSVQEFPGIKPFADKDIISCEAKLAYFVCEDCSAVCDVMAYTEHVWGEVGRTDATCDAEGTVYYSCTVPGCNTNNGAAAEKEEALPKLQHILVYNASKEYYADIVAAGNTYVETCSRGCTYSETYNVVFNTTNIEATCTTPGKVIISWTDHKGNNYSIENVGEAKGHSLNGVKMQATETGYVYAWTDGCGILEFNYHGATEDVVAQRKINEDYAVIAYFICDDCHEVVDVWAQIVAADYILPDYITEDEE